MRMSNYERQRMDNEHKTGKVILPVVPIGDRDFNISIRRRLVAREARPLGTPSPQILRFFGGPSNAACRWHNTAGARPTTSFVHSFFLFFTFSSSPTLPALPRASSEAHMHKHEIQGLGGSQTCEIWRDSQRQVGELRCDFRDPS